MEFLLNYIDNNAINRIRENNDPNVVFNLITNSTGVIKNIEYLKSIGITKIDELLIYRIELFFKDKEEIEQYFLNNDLPNLVKMINLDVELLDLF